MFVLDNGDKIRGDASAASVVDYSFYGLDDGTLKQLADGQLAAATGDLYTADSVDVISTLVLVNTDTSARTINLFLLPSGGTARRLIPKDLSLGAGYSLHFSGEKIAVMDTSGNIITSFSNLISDTAYGAGWNGVTTIAPSKNAVYDEMELRTKAAANLGDNKLVRGDGGVKGVQESTIVVSDAGEMTNPSQPAFLIKVNTEQENVTGDGTVYNITGAFWTEAFDQGNDASNGIFTASITGKYQLSALIDIDGLLLAHTSGVFIICTSNRSFYVYLNPYACRYSAGDQLSIPISILLDMDVNDTAYLRCGIYSGTKVINVKIETYFSGVLIC